ncbi:YitT family protein [Amedibacillus sp. YH-ame10]
MKFNLKENITEIITIIIGNLVIAAGVSFFVLPLNILSGGVAGISIALKPIFHLEPTIVINVLTIGLYIAGAIFLGKRFALKTIVSTIVYPLFITILSAYSHNVHITDNVLLASIYAGVCVGVGIGMVYRVGGSTGGMDIPPLIINKYTKIPLPKLVVCIDGATVLLGALTYGVEASMVGLVSVWVCGQVIDKVIMIGAHEAKNVMIISEKHEELMQVIYQNIDRGATILHAQGGYTREEKPVIMMVLVKKQYAELNRIISNVDPEAFVIVSDVNEVHGEGFTYLQQL